MWPILSGSFRQLQRAIYRWSINDALALNRRNEVRPDGLTLDSVCSRLDICWHARDVHPWDYALPPDERELAFHQQTMADIEAAVRRILERRPEVEEVEIRVLDFHSSALLALGTVRRSALNEAGLCAPSVRMRLGGLGIRYLWSPRDQGSGRTEPKSQPSMKTDQKRIA